MYFNRQNILEGYCWISFLLNFVSFIYDEHNYSPAISFLKKEVLSHGLYTAGYYVPIQVIRLIGFCQKEKIPFGNLFRNEIINATYVDILQAAKDFYFVSIVPEEKEDYLVIHERSYHHYLYLDFLREWRIPIRMSLQNANFMWKNNSR